MILSFAWTKGALVAGRKTVTRRDWSDVYFERWCRAWDKGSLVHDAYDKSPRFGRRQIGTHGKKIGQIELTCRPYKERLGDMPESDLEAEGGLWNSLDDYIELQGGDPDKVMCVLRFRWLGAGPRLL